jgi:hypothetical protein
MDPKGLLTYRTIQFSMSSGCFHPKNLQAIKAHLRLRPPFPSGESTKGPQADPLFTSAFQTSVVFAVNLPGLRQPSTKILNFFSTGVAS